MVRYPYEKIRDHGPFGLLYGLGLGIFNFGIKSLAGMSISHTLMLNTVSDVENPTVAVSIGAYPLMGVYKSIWTMINRKTQHSIEIARLLEGRFMAEQGRYKGASDRVVTDTFDALLQKQIRH